jgi:hypothetical protein
MKVFAPNLKIIMITKKVLDKISLICYTINGRKIVCLGYQAIFIESLPLADNPARGFFMSSRKWRKKNREKIRKYKIEYWAKNRNRYILLKRASRTEAKNIIIKHYGGKCVCCGETHREFLTLDHINGGGNKERKELKIKAGTEFYLYVIKNNFPNGYRLLCSNCNCSRGFYGYCPHEKEKEVIR